MCVPTWSRARKIHPAVRRRRSRHPGAAPPLLHGVLSGDNACSKGVREPSVPRSRARYPVVRETRVRGVAREELGGEAEAVDLGAVASRSISSCRNVRPPQATPAYSLLQVSLGLEGSLVEATRPPRRSSPGSGASRVPVRRTRPLSSFPLPAHGADQAWRRRWHDEELSGSCPPWPLRRHGPPSTRMSSPRTMTSRHPGRAPRQGLRVVNVIVAHPRDRQQGLRPPRPRRREGRQRHRHTG